MALSFDEQMLGPHGDFAGEAIGTLDLGVNSINGFVGNANFGFTPDGDAFRVTLPENLSITSIVLNVTGFENGSVTQSSGIELAPPNSGSESFNGDGTVTLSPFMISGSPIELVLGGGVDDPLDTQLRNWDRYSWAVEIVVAVPEPSTALLLSAGLLGLAVRRRSGA